MAFIESISAALPLVKGCVRCAGLCGDLQGQGGPPQSQEPGACNRLRVQAQGEAVLPAMHSPDLRLRTLCRKHFSAQHCVRAALTSVVPEVG